MSTEIPGLSHESVPLACLGTRMYTSGRAVELESRAKAEACDAFSRKLPSLVFLAEDRRKRRSSMTCAMIRALAGVAQTMPYHWY